MKNNRMSSPLFNFFTRSMILAFAVVMVYHFTIGVTLTKIDKIMDQIIWVRGKVESVDKTMIQKAVHRLPSKINLSTREEEMLRDDTREILRKLSPIFDELYSYKPTSDK